MDDPMKIDLAIVARDLKLPPEKIEKTVELLDAGNTIPFITRFRKDLTGGLNEQQILAIKQRVAQLRALSERKSFVLKSIESQGKLTGELKTQIKIATTSRRLEDLYLPFKPKKQSRASIARQRGLEPLADDIFLATSPDVDIATRATEFVRVDKGLNSVDDVIKGVGDLLAERFSENDELRSTLRKIMWTDGKLTTQSLVIQETAADPGPAPGESTGDGSSNTATSTESGNTGEPNSATKRTTTSDPMGPTAAPVAEILPAKLDKVSNDPAPQALKELKSESSVDSPATPAGSLPIETHSSGSSSGAVVDEVCQSAIIESTATEPVDAPGPVQNSPTVESRSSDSAPDINETNDAPPPVSESVASDAIATTESSVTPVPIAQEPNAAPLNADPTKSKKKKKKKKKPTEDPFKDFKNFKQPIRQVPNHRILAINRGERAGQLKVKISVDGNKLSEASLAALVPAEHPFREFMQKCASDALNRMIAPSLEREIRRELTEAAEKHAVEVFANNLRNLLLQPPIRNRTVLAIDPGFKRGCSVAVLDPFGNVLDSGHVFVVGNQSRRDESKQMIAAWVKKHKADVIAIGNGAACRQTEQMVSDTIAEQLGDLQTTYVMVNEAGASTYSTSEIGRSELPHASPSIRSAISIGRRLQDPLSELVKISPANIGVGMYQHDVKAKHLSESLDEVVRFCVNQVGVDVNTASPSLLKYVSGLNSLTARRVVEHRQTNGRFRNRNQLKEISGFGDATFVQSAGFLRIHGGDSPLDCTSIHPESYDIANDILKRIDVSAEDFFPKELSALESVAPPSIPAPLEDSTLSGGSPNVESSKDSTASIPPPLPATQSESGTVPGTEAGLSSESRQSEEIPKTVVDESPESGNVEPGSEPASIDAASNAVPEPARPTEPISTEMSAPTPDSTVGPATTQAATNVSHATSPAQADEWGENSANRKEILKKISDLNVDDLALHHSAGRLLVKDILMALKRPKWDPRDKVSKPIFRRGIIKADDLKPNMQLDGQVVNVVDFGVFVDIGLGESSLVHVSQLSNHFIRDPHRFYSVGDVLKVWVSEIDAERRRVKLTAVRPGSKKPPSRRARSTGGKDSSASSTNPRITTGSSESRSSTPPARKPGKYGNKYGGRPKGKSAQRPSYGKSDTPYKSHVRKSQPKEVKPITDGMLKGVEPMRSFSDLAQFVNKKPKDKKTGKTDKDSPS